MWHPDAYLTDLLRGIRPEFAFCAPTVEEWALWRDKLKKQFIAALGPVADKAAPLQPREIERTDCGDYVRARVVIQTCAGLEMPMYVLRPAGVNGRRPAVIACHGHGYGSKEIAGLMPDGTTEMTEPTYQNCFAVELVRRGFIVCVPELLGFGDRKMEEDARNGEYSSCHKISTFLLQIGRTLAGYRVYETIRALDYMSGLPDVDADKIGCMGISGGGLVAGFAAASDERFRATVVSGYVNTFRDSILSIRHCVDNYVPGLSLHAEMPDIISLTAPRPLLVESGTEDAIFPIGATLEACRQIASVYRLLDRAEHFETDIFTGDHRIHGSKAYAWLHAKLFDQK